MVWYDDHDNDCYGIMIKSFVMDYKLLNYYNTYDNDCYGMIMTKDTCNIL